ncbi:MAG TPA: hypothetical protein VFJ04_08845 [Rhodanobacteraceae bacterium]|jgi:hypothetical protein|nr:hypothetical protein [Rhodanobacteraceae bacterium]
MTPVIDRSVRVVALAVLGVALAACGKHSETPAPAPAATSTAVLPATPGSAPVAAASAAPSAASSTAAPATAAPFAFARLTLGSDVGKDYKVSKARSTFAPNEHTLYAAVETTGQATGATLNALWTYQDGQTVSNVTQSITADGPATTTFTVHNPADWPLGKYKVAISLNGKAVASQDFSVKKG